MTKIIQRHDTASNWATVNPILSLGEMGVEDDTHKFKFGDGVSTWSQLSYAGGESELDKYLTGSTTDSTTTISTNNKALVLDAPTIAVGDNLVTQADGADANLYLNQGNVVAGSNVTVERTATGITINSTNEGYTKAETDELLEEKADKFTTTSPLTLSEKSDAEYNGTITDGTISFGGGASFTTISNVLYVGQHDGDKITRYVALPLDVNTIVKAPIMGNFNNTSEYGQTREQVVLGDFDSEGKFIPYVGMLNENRTNNLYGRMNGGATVSDINPNGTYGLAFTYTSPSSHTHSAYTRESAGPDDAPIEGQSIYIEKYIDDNGMLCMGLWTVGNLDGSANNMVSTTFDNGMGTELQEACKKSKWVLFYPRDNSFTPNIGDFKIYETNERHGWNKAGLLSGITNAPYKQPLISSTANIALSIDNSTIKVNENGQLYAVAQETPAPTNMVTTDTEQEITGSKLFSNGLKVGGYAGISDNNNKPFIQVVESPTDQKLVWGLGSNDTGGNFNNIVIKRGSDGNYINIDSGNLTANLPIGSSTQEGIVQVDGTTIVSNDGIISAIGSGGTTTTTDGIKGDYSTHYGIVDCPNGILEYTATTKSVTLQPGVVMQLAGADSLTTNASALTATLTSTSDIVLFYVGRELLECGKVDYQENEPTDNGVDNYQAWYKPSLGKWQFKSNDTGNVWREITATPIANIRFNTEGTTITRVDYIGYRILNDDILVDQTQIDSVQDSIKTLTDNVNTLGENVGNCVTLTGAQTIFGIKSFPEDGLNIGKFSIYQGNGANNNTINLGKTTNCEGMIVEAMVRAKASPRQGTIQIRSGSTLYQVLDTGTAFKQVKLTKAEYEALTTKDENTMYIIVG